VTLPTPAQGRRWLKAGIIFCLLGSAAFFLNGATVSAQSLPQFLQPVPGKPKAPDFTLPDLDEKKVSLSDFRGKVVIVNFWATWCPPCRFEIPAMQRAWVKLRDSGVMLLAVHLGGDADEVWSFAEQYGVQFPVLIDANSSVARKWRMVGLPTTYVVDADGRLVLRAIGGREWDDPAILKTILDLRK